MVVAEAVDHGAVSGNFCVGRPVICEFLGKSYRPEQESLTGSGGADDDHALPQRDLYVLLAKHGAAGRRSDLQVLKGYLVARYLNELNVSLGCSDPIHVNHRFAEPGDTLQQHASWRSC